MPTHDIIMAAAGSSVAYSSVMFFGGGASPYIKARPFNTTTHTLGTAFSNPATLPLGAVANIAVHPSGGSVAYSEYTGGTYGIGLYPWTNSGWGAKSSYPSGSSTISQGGGVSFSPDGVAVALCSINSATPFIEVFKLNGTGTALASRYANPSTMPAASTGAYDAGCVFSPASGAVFFSAPTSSGSHVVSAYAWNSTTGFGTKYADPSTKIAYSASTQAAQGITINPAGNVVAFGLLGTPCIAAYQWDSSTGWGSKYANPATLPANTYGVNFTPNGNYLIACDYGGGRMISYPFSYASGFGTAVIKSYAGAYPYNCSISKDSSTIAVGTNSAGTLIYPIIGGTIGTAYASDSTLGGIQRGVALNF